MKIIKHLISISILLNLLMAQVAFSETAVIVHPSNGDSFNEKMIEKIFLGKTKSFSDGGSILPVNQKANGNIRKAFDKAVLGKSSSQIKSYWSKLMFTGKGTPPKEVDGDAEVKNLAASNPSVIGYIDASAVDDSVKVIHTF